MPVDSTDANVVETSSCLKTIDTLRTDNFYRSIIDRIGLAHVQLRPWVLKAAMAMKK